MNNEKISDKQLISNYLAGNQASIEVLIIRHKSRVYSYIMQIVRDRALADDIFQDTFIKVINTLRSGRYNEEGKFIPWVMRIAHNLVIDHFRKNNRIPVISANRENFDIFDTIKIYDPSAEEKMVNEQIKTDLKNLIELLPPEQKEVLFMRHYANMSFKDIAEAVDISINTALGRMRYALINLRKLIEEKNIVLHY